MLLNQQGLRALLRWPTITDGIDQPDLYALVGVAVESDDDTTPPPQLPPLAPTITPNGGEFNGSVIVTINSPFTVRFSLDNSNPKTSATAIDYTTDFSVGDNTKVRAYAFNEFGTSPEAIADFVITDVPTEPIDLDGDISPDHPNAIIVRREVTTIIVRQVIDED